MSPFEITHCLESMRVLVDSREQDTERARERYKRFPCQYDRCKLEYGDYSLNCDLGQGNWLYNQTSEKEKIYPFVSVERKMNLDELASCFTRDRKRFEAEFQRASEHDAMIYLIVENGSWEHIINGKYRSKLSSKAFLASILAWTVRYNLKLLFCKEETTSVLIYNILYRELKERLERGEFDARAGMDKAAQEDKRKLSLE